MYGYSVVDVDFKDVWFVISLVVYCEFIALISMKRSTLNYTVSMS